MNRKKSFGISRFTVYGVVQFVLYMGMFTVFFWHYQTEFSNPSWRMLGLLAALFGLIVSLTADFAYKDDGILPPFLNVIAPVALYLLFMVWYCFFNWTLPPADYFLITFAKFYLSGTLGASVLMLVISM